MCTYQSVISVSSEGTGKYRIRSSKSLPYGLGFEDCHIMVCGYGVTGTGSLADNAIKATLMGAGDLYFDVYCSDDDTLNNGGFNFIVYPFV